MTGNSTAGLKYRDSGACGEGDRQECHIQNRPVRGATEVLRLRITRGGAARQFWKNCGPVVGFRVEFNEQSQLHGHQLTISPANKWR